MLVLGNFNAKSSAWGSTVTDARGEELEEWSTSTGLILRNRGSVQRCVCRWDGSIVDITFACPIAAQYVNNWKVLDEVETLSISCITYLPLFRPRSRIMRSVTDILGPNGQSRILPKSS